MTAGYSGTPLARKLGIKASMHVAIFDAPVDYRASLEPLPEHVVFEAKTSVRTQLVHLFVTDKQELTKALHAYRKALNSDASVWVSWPKKASKVATTVTEDVIREVALPLGFVDIKVCAVSEIWSGLKLVVRRELR
ncbi:DUF3052 family protein [Dyella dinghuensis]|uniref:DUF3052 family protein n=1 Tax=Dyella dinghuensis TaxID=1920169 RepID=A0A3S0Q0H4_9GAMM|nr:DUF3052 family protein [Dyella dinghuensis]